MEQSKQYKDLMKNELVASILRLQVSRPESYNWKEDYARALEEKHENIYYCANR